MAFFRYGTSALGSLAEIKRPFWRWVIAVLIYGTCAEAPVSEGPTALPSRPNSLVAASTPLSIMVKYGLLMFFGITVILRSFLIGLSSPKLAVTAIAIRITINNDVIVCRFIGWDFGDLGV